MRGEGGAVVEVMVLGVAGGGGGGIGGVVHEDRGDYVADGNDRRGLGGGEIGRGSGRSDQANELLWAQRKEDIQNRTVNFADNSSAARQSSTKAVASAPAPASASASTYLTAHPPPDSVEYLMSSGDEFLSDFASMKAEVERVKSALASSQNRTRVYEETWPLLNKIQN